MAYLPWLLVVLTGSTLVLDTLVRSPGVSMANSQSLINSEVFDETHIFLGELIQLPSGKHTKNELENHHD